MSTRPTDETPELLTVEGWLRKMNELGYFMSKPHVRYETKGWKSVAEFVGLLMSLCLFFGLILGGAQIGAKYYDHKTKCEKHL